MRRISRRVDRRTFSRKSAEPIIAQAPAFGMRLNTPSARPIIIFPHAVWGFYDSEAKRGEPMFSPTQDAPAGGKRVWYSLLFSLFLAAALATSPAFAQIYQWKDPETGSTKLTNLRPPWYRNDQQSGPRTQLILHGQLIDDTAVPATQEHLDQVHASLDAVTQKQSAEARTAQQQAIQAQGQALAQDQQQATQAAQAAADQAKRDAEAAKWAAYKKHAVEQVEAAGSGWKPPPWYKPPPPNLPNLQ